MQFPDQKNMPIKANPVGQAETLNRFTNPLDLVYLVLHNWWIIAICIATTGLLAVGYLFWEKPTYRATSRIEILQENRVDTRTRISYYEHLERSLQRQKLLMSSDALHNELRKELKDEWEPVLGPKNLAPSFAIDEVYESRGTMVDIQVDSTDPKYALAYLQNMIAGYREFREEELSEVNDNAITGLRLEEQHVLEELETAKADLEKFEGENQVLMAQEREQMDSAFLNQLMARLKAVRMERTILENQHDEILNADAVTIREALEMTRQTQQRSSVSASRSSQSNTESKTSNSNTSGTNWVNAESVVAADTGDIAAVIDWEQQEEVLAEMENTYQQRLEVFLPTHPEMEALKIRIDSMRTNLQRKADIALKRFRARFQALRMQEDGIEEALNNFKQEQTLSAERRNRYQQLKSKVVHLQKKYNLVYSRLLENSGTTDMFFMRVIKPAHVLSKPVSPKKAKILMMALAAGAALGGAIILLVELLRPEELRAELLENDLHIPCIATVPNWEEVLKPENFNPEFDIFAVKRGVNQAATEVYRGFRHKLDSLNGNKEKMCLAITSPKRGDGKTFNTLNLAVPYAWDGRRVLVIDGDFRRARLTHVVLGERPEKGFTNCILDPKNTKPIDRVQPIANTGIDLLPAGEFDETVPEKTKTQLIQSFISELYEHYDIILIDTAPVNIIVETAQICRAVDGVILFSDARSSRAEAKHAMRELQGIKVLGFCLNGVVREKVGSYGTYYGYGTYGSDEAYLSGNEETSAGLKKSGRTTRAPWSKKTLKS